jgi:hypothetical protein
MNHLSQEEIDGLSSGDLLGSTLEISLEEAEALKDIVNEEILEDCRKDLSCGQGGNIVEIAIGKINPGAEVAGLKRMIDLQNSALVKRLIASEILGSTPSRKKSVIPTSRMSRSEMVRMAVGDYPVFFSTPRKTMIRKAKAYIDVSGSMEIYYAWMYSLILRLAEDVEIEPVFWSDGYSNIYCKGKTDYKEVGKGIIEGDMNMIRDGKVITGGGTNLDLVLRHIISNPDPEFIILCSDGCFNINQPLLNKVNNISSITKIGLYFGLEKQIGTNHEVGYFKNMKKICSKVFTAPMAASKHSF